MEPLGTSPEAMLAAALGAAEHGEIAEAQELAAEVLRRDPFNREAQRLVRDAEVPPGELRRLTILFCDLVGSTALSTRHSPGTYGRMLERYHRRCADIIEAHGGRVTRRIGDGVLALFGHPAPLGDDTRRAVRAGIALTDSFTAAGDGRTGSDETPDGTPNDPAGDFRVRVAIHHGAVHLDLVDSEIYGFVPNLAARLQEAANTNSVVVSEEVVDLVGEFFETERHAPVSFKGIEEPIAFHTVRRELPASRQPRPTTPIIDRKAESARVVRVLGLAEDRSGGDGSPRGVDPDERAVVVIRGEIGIGKSRLLTHLGNLGVGHGFDVRQITCATGMTTTVFGIAGELLRVDLERPPAATAEGRLACLRSDLATVGLDPADTLGVLAPLLGIVPADGFEPPDVDITKLHDAIVEAVRRWLAALSRHERSNNSSGLVLIIDDVHLADPSSRDLLASLARDPVDGVRVIASARNGATSISGRMVEVIELGPLAGPDAAKLLAERDDGLDQELKAEILRRAEGNPWYLEELLAEAKRGADAGGPAGDGLVAGTNLVPNVLYEPILARIYSPGIDIGLAQTAATIGTAFTCATLAPAVNRTPRRLMRGLEAMVERGILGGNGAGEYWFCHSLLRDVAYELQPDDVRQTTHATIARTLVESRASGASVSWSTIAGHFHRAGDIGAAIDAYEHAADEARARGALFQGRLHLDTAIDLLGTITDPEYGPTREAQLRLKRGFLCVTVGGNADPQAVSDYEACQRLTENNPTGHEFVDTLVVLWSYHTARGDMERAGSLLDAVERTGVTDDPVARAENDAGRGVVEFLRGRFDSADRSLAKAARTIGEFGGVDRELSRWQFPNDPATGMHIWLGATRWQLGDVTGFREHARRARERAARLAFPHGPFSACQALYVESWVCSEMGEVESALELADELSEVSTRHGFDFWNVSATTARTIALAHRHALLESPDLALVEEMTEQLTRSELVSLLGDARLFAPCTLALRSTLHLALGQRDTALDVLAEAEHLAVKTGNEFYLAEVLRLTARVQFALGNDRGHGLLVRAATTASEQNSLVFELRALADLENLGALTGAHSIRLDELRSAPGVVAGAGPFVPVRIRG